MPDDDKVLNELDQELDESVPRHIVINPTGHLIHGYSDDEAAGVLSALAEYLHERAVGSYQDQDRDEE